MNKLESNVQDTIIFVFKNGLSIAYLGTNILPKKSDVPVLNCEPWILPTESGKESGGGENLHFFHYNGQYCVNFLS